MFSAYKLPDGEGRPLGFLSLCRSCTRGIRTSVWTAAGLAILGVAVMAVGCEPSSLRDSFRLSQGEALAVGLGFFLAAILRLADNPVDKASRRIRRRLRLVNAHTFDTPSKRKAMIAQALGRVMLFAIVAGIVGVIVVGALKGLDSRDSGPSNGIAIEHTTSYYRGSQKVGETRGLSFGGSSDGRSALVVLGALAIGVLILLGLLLWKLGVVLTTPTEAVAERKVAALGDLIPIPVYSDRELLRPKGTLDEFVSQHRRRRPLGR